TVQPTGTPALRLPGARFDHTAHRAVSCAECHTTWDQAAVVRGAEAEPLNVPGIDSCRRCHAPTAVVNGSPQGGARHDCIACHLAGAARVLADLNSLSKPGDVVV